MKKRTTITSIKAIAISSLSLLYASAAHAAISIGNSAIQNQGPATLDEVVPKITNTLLTAAGIIAVIMIIVGGLMYSLSAGDSKKAGTAKDTILYAVIGLVITLLASAIVNFVLGRF